MKPSSHFDRKFARFIHCGVLTVIFVIASQSGTVAQYVVAAWGANALGQTNLPASLTNITAIAAGSYHNIGLRSNGTVVIWGSNLEGETNVPASATNVAAIAAGAFHCIALRTNGTVVVWGAQTNVAPAATNVMAIAGGWRHTLALRSNGTVVAWAYAATAATNVPAGLSNVIAVAAGNGLSAVLRSNGTVLAWGDGTFGSTNVPAGLSNVVAISARDYHGLALKSDGRVVSWGDQTNIPANITNVAAVAAGGVANLALTHSGAILGWGNDGFGNTNAPPRPVNVVAIAEGEDNSTSLGLDNDAFAMRFPLTGSNAVFLANTTGATHEPNEPLHTAFDSSGLGTVWFTWTAPSAGGVVIQSYSDSGIFQPMMAVYTGNSLTNLTRIADDIGSFSQARMAFSATSNLAYQIVVDAGDGYVTNYLTLSPPPPNDLFANATAIPGIYYTNSGSFAGANREANEPSHGDTNLAQTLWWSWTAPTNTGVSSSPVALIADAVSFPPGLGVYTGSALSNLTAVPLVTQTNGMSRTAGFTAQAGTTYRIALAGSQWPTPNGQNVLISPQYGSYRFRLDNRALILLVSNSPAMTTNGDGSVTFSADLTVTNQGGGKSNPLRVSLCAISGVSVKSTNATSYLVDGTNFVSSATNVSIYTPSPSSLGQNQSAKIHVTGTAPAPITDPNNLFGIGYGLYAELQEQPLAGHWFTIDQVLLGYDVWPTVGQFAGPGGGVLRLDPSYLGLSSFDQLSSVVVNGPASVPEGSSTNFTGQATYSDGTLVPFTNTVWLASLFNIVTNGVFTAGNVTSNTPVTITAVYSFEGFLFDAVTNITVMNLPPSFISVKVLSNGALSLTLSSVPGRSNALEATTNLSPAIWLPLVTNASSNGIIIFNDFSRTNIPRRFYRAREL